MRHIIGKEFDRDETVEVSIFGLVNDTHAAPTQFLNNSVVRNGLADHWADMLGSRSRAVNESEDARSVLRNNEAGADHMGIQSSSELESMTLILASAAWRQSNPGTTCLHEHS
jgi:hypothetical protein